MKSFYLMIFSLLGLIAAGCNQADSAAAQKNVQAAPAMTVYKSPACGCCGKWVDHVKAHGFDVTVVEQSNVMPKKQALGVPPELYSCHTAEVAGYSIEGHVPASDILRLLKERPQAKGLAVAGMPIGSPGMEVGDRQDNYTVWLFSEHGQQAFNQHGNGNHQHAH